MQAVGGRTDGQKRPPDGRAGMHVLGHVGVGFAAAAPLSFVLDGLGLGGATLPATVVLVGLSTLPDVDHHLPWTAHRGATHSVPFAVAVGLGVASCAGVAASIAGWGEADLLAALGFAIGAGAVGLHVLVDLFTPMGVPPLWPLSRERRTLAVVRSANRRANLALFALGLACWSGAVWSTLA